MSYPNNECGECPVWLALGEDTNIKSRRSIDKRCLKCNLFKSQRFVRHIPTQCCYPLEPDGKTVIICDAHLTPNIDGKIFWEYVDEYVDKVITPSDPYANHR